ncbi:hypothetical protein ACGF12_35540 [Kitasatospora sp. NPDC048296]|uniref:hypothetical protein n=1 Tax=Kitasatospora sp. NPDC048296 TaxID=3364048 RepID=UPI003724326E
MDHAVVVAGVQAQARALGQRATSLRRARYRGLLKVSLQHAYSATAINVIRFDAHWTDRSRRSRTSRITRLAHQLAA